jgi:hypothetical protein
MVSVLGVALALAFLAFSGAPARGTALAAGPTVTATAQPLGIQLEWTDPSPAGVLGYIIRRGEAAGDEARWPLTDFPVQGDSWLDEEIVPGMTYYYVVVPVRKDGALGMDSAEVKATAVSVAADRRLVHFHMDATGAMIRTAAGDKPVALLGKPLVDHGRVMLTVDDIVTLTGADLRQVDGLPVIVLKLPSGQEMTMEVGKNAMAFAKASRTDISAPMLRDGRIYVPVRWVIEAINGELRFNPIDQSVTMVVAR